eukprot:gene13609-19484_t
MEAPQYLTWNEGILRLVPTFSHSKDAANEASRHRESAKRSLRYAPSTAKSSLLVNPDGKRTAEVGQSIPACNEHTSLHDGQRRWQCAQKLEACAGVSTVDVEALVAWLRRFSC